MDTETHKDTKTKKIRDKGKTEPRWSFAATSRGTSEEARKEPSKGFREQLDLGLAASRIVRIILFF